MNGGLRWLMAGMAAATLTSLGVGAQEPAKVAFASGRGAEGQLNLYLMNEDGTNVKAVTEGAGFAFDPALSPDGKRLAYAYRASRAEMKGEIYLVNPDGSGKTQLTQLGVASIFPRWSPDGKRIAFTTVGGFEANAPPQLKMHVMDADGKNHVELGDGWVSDWTRDGKRRSIP